MTTLNSAEAYNQKPDIVGDFFDMQKRYLTYCPQIVFGSELIVHGVSTPSVESNPSPNIFKYSVTCEHPAEAPTLATK